MKLSDVKPNKIVDKNKFIVLFYHFAIRNFTIVDTSYTNNKLLLKQYKKPL